MRIWKSKKKRIERLVKQYKEGFRLMRHGDGADEWYGIKIMNEARDELAAMNRDPYGKKIKRLKEEE